MTKDNRLLKLIKLTQRHYSESTTIKKRQAETKKMTERIKESKMN